LRAAAARWLEQAQWLAQPRLEQQLPVL